MICTRLWGYLFILMQVQTYTGGLAASPRVAMQDIQSPPSALIGPSPPFSQAVYCSWHNWLYLTPGMDACWLVGLLAAAVYNLRRNGASAQPQQYVPLCSHREIDSTWVYIVFYVHMQHYVSISEVWPRNIFGDDETSRSHPCLGSDPLRYNVRQAGSFRGRLAIVGY